MNVDVLFLNNVDMSAAGVGDMHAALYDVERAYVLFEEGDVNVPGKVVMRFGKTKKDEVTNGRINCMPGFIGGEYNMAGVKWIGSGPQNYKLGLPRASVTLVLNDPETKLPVCFADGTEVSAKRTGASGGVAMKYLSKENSRVLTICGAGVQSRTQLEAAVIVRPSLEKVYIYDLYLDRAEAFAEEMSAKYPQLKIIPVELEQLPDCVSESDIVITVTLTLEPIIKAKWVTRGTLLINMAGYEMEYGCITMADKVVVDFWDTVKHRLSSSVARMYDEGLFTDDGISAEIGEIVAHKKSGRDNDDQIIYFNAVGAGILDFAVAIRCYRKAKEQDLGTVLPYWR